jgi:hypothetical protein
MNNSKRAEYYILKNITNIFDNYFIKAKFNEIKYLGIYRYEVIITAEEIGKNALDLFEKNNFELTYISGRIIKNSPILEIHFKITFIEQRKMKIGDILNYE